MYNRVILMGRLVADPELKNTQSGIAMCNFRIAVDKPAKQGEEKKADFISVTCWRQTAEFVSRYFAKGKLIHLEGRLQNNDYTDQNGVKHYSMVVNADNVAFCGDKSQSQSQQQGGGYAPYAQQRRAAAGDSLPYAPTVQAATCTPQYGQPPQYRQPPQSYNAQPPQYQQTTQAPQYGQPPQYQAPQYQQAPPPAQNQPPPIGDLSDYEEILADGEVPF